MYSVQELQHAKNYPFSKLAKSVLRESGLSLEDTPDDVIGRAKAMVCAAFSDEGYSTHIQSSPQLLRNEILAFPVAKIIVSIIGRVELYRKFSNMVAESVHASARNEKDGGLFDLASELGVKFDIPESRDFFAQMAMQDYLRADLEATELKLVNQSLEGGKIFMSRNEFARLLPMIAGQQVKDSLPVQVKGVPQKFSDAAKSAEKEFATAVRKKFSKTDFGEVQPESFPPCMSKIYTELLAGVKATHSARFAFATFLHSIGMSQEKIVDMYRATPNFNEKITRYQVQRLVSKGSEGYSSPGCDKMRSYNLCVANCPNTYHPVQFYSREVHRQGSAAAPQAIAPAEQ